MSTPAELMVEKIETEFPAESGRFSVEHMRGVTFLRYEYLAVEKGLHMIDELVDAEIDFAGTVLRLLNTHGYVMVSKVCDLGVLLIDIVAKNQIEGYLNLGFNSEEDLCI
jgi:hypothetical protein